MSKVEMINVGFGDCFILSERDTENEIREDSLLVDFGSKSHIAKSIVTAVANQITSDNIQRCLLTHFHDDHYKGINELAKIPAMQGQFTEIILPNVFFSSTTYKIKLAQLVFLRKYGAAWNEAYNYVSSIVSFYKLLNTKGLLHFVSKGSIFSIGPKKYNVLSPYQKNINAESNTGFLDFFEEMMSFEQKQLYDGIVSTASQILTFENNNIRLENTQIIGRIDEINAFMNQIDKFSKYEIVFSAEKRKRINSFNLSFSKNWNELSIVFAESNGGIVMTGDMPKRIWEKVKGNIAYPVTVFKVPHHGTKTYFCSDFPKEANYLISNGSYSSWDITALYPLYYTNIKLHCTNYNGCEYYAGKGATCSCVINCGCPLGKDRIRVYY